MLWIILRCILLALLALLLLILFVPAHVLFSYDRGELALGVRFGPVSRPLYPSVEKKPRKKKAEKPKEEKPKEEKPEEEKKKKKKFSVNLDQILYTLETLPPILGRALRRTVRRIRISPLKVWLLVAGTDPADTATLYGKLQAALGAGMPALHRLVRISDQDVRLFVDFQETKPDCIAEVGLSIRVWDLLVVAACAGASGIKWFLGFRKLASAPDHSSGKTAAKPPEEKAGGGGTAA